MSIVRQNKIEFRTNEYISNSLKKEATKRGLKSPHLAAKQIIKEYLKK
jgi:hypothetical protein